MKKTTLSAIRSFSPCVEGWQKLLESLGNTTDMDTEVSYLQILESNGISDAIWALRTDRQLAVTFAVACAEQVLHIYEKSCPGNDAPRKAIEAVQKYINNPDSITREELLEARRIAYAAAAYNAYAAKAAAYAAADAAAAAYDVYAAAYAAAAAAAAYDASYADAAAYAYASRQFSPEQFKIDIYKRVVSDECDFLCAHNIEQVASQEVTR